MYSIKLQYTNINIQQHILNYLLDFNLFNED